MSNLSLLNVSYTYKGASEPAVSGVSFEFERGKLYAISGASGSGKSTLLSILAGLDMPSGGKALFNEKDLAEMDLDRYRRESIAMVFQAFHLFPLLTVTENVCYPLELCGVKPNEAKPRAEKLLESVGISREQMRRFPAKLSGGEQQRVAIARCLAAGAKTILADEPTGNLDAANAERVMNIFRTLARKQNYCVIIVTHDAKIAESADVVLRMGGE